MPAPRAPMICPKCGDVMTCHAEKPSEPRTREEAAATSAGLGTMIEQVHQCPGCGAIESRRMASG